MISCCGVGWRLRRRHEEPIIARHRTDPPAVVVVTYNSARDIDGFLDSLDALDPEDTEEPLQVVVVDNASSDDTLERVRRHRRKVEVVENGGNLGYAAGLNAGLAVVEDDRVVVVANPDIRVQPGFLAAIDRAIGQPGVGVVVPRLLDENGRIAWSLRRSPSATRAFADALLGGRRAGRWGVGETVGTPEAYRTPGEVAWATGALLVILPACRARVGPWDPSFFLYSEETDYLLRVRDAGFSVRFEPEAVAVHRGGDLHRASWLWELMTLNRVRLVAKRQGRTRTKAFWFTVLLNEVLRAPRSSNHRRAARALLRERRDLLHPTPREGDVRIGS